MMYGGFYGWYYDPTIWLVLVAAILSILASAKVKGTFNKYSSVRSRTGMTGAEAAKRLLNSQGINDVAVREVRGNLTDHYDPRTKTVNLSESVYHATSVSAIGVAAHECGHAIQHHVGYAPLNLRSAFVPIASLGSQLGLPIILLGVLFGGMGSTMVTIGILLFSLAVVFQLITLPVEFNASNRAVRLLDENGILSGEEVKQTREVLNSAALTYVAAATASILQLLRLILIFGGRRNSDN